MSIVEARSLIDAGVGFDILRLETLGLMVVGESLEYRRKLMSVLRSEPPLADPSATVDFISLRSALVGALT